MAVRPRTSHTTNRAIVVDSSRSTAYSVLIVYTHFEQSPRRHDIDIIVSNASGEPIYEQIASQIKGAILTGDLGQGEALPSIRSLANSLRISVITTKRAYSELEAQGFIDTVQGKGSFVTGGNVELLREERMRQVELLLSQAIDKAQAIGVTSAELHEMIDTLEENE